MISTNVMWALLAIEIVIALACVVERDWNKVIYWIGACIIQYSVIKM